MNATLSRPPVHEQGSQTAPSDRELLERLTVAGDESAFALLLRRHGPMVLGVCQRVLGDHHDAEDAFQATFLVLARRARSIRSPERLTGWLYGVAHRTALKLRAMRHRRGQVEGQALPASPPLPPLECAWREVREALDEEIARLEDPMRASVILCYLEGKTHEEAACQLGRPVGSMSWLLGRALSTLRQRLADRGMTLTGGMPSLLLSLLGAVPVSDELLLAALRSSGAIGTATPLALLVKAVLRDLGGEQTSRVVRGVMVAILILLGVGSAGAAGYKALTPGSPPVSVEAESCPTAGGCGACSR